MLSFNIRISFIILQSVLLLALPVNIDAQSRNKAKTTATTKKTSSKKTTSKKSTAKKPSGPTINGLRNEQARIKQNIKKQEQALKANKAAVQEKLKRLMSINGEMNKHRQTIDSLNNQVTSLNNQLSMLDAQLMNLNAQLAERKAKYVKSMRYMARNQSIQNQLMFIFSADNLQQMFRRMRFVRQYAAYQRTQGKSVQEQQTRINNKMSQLDALQHTKTNLLVKGRQEQAQLETQKEEHQKVVNSLQKQQKTIQLVIDDQKKKDAALNAQIDKLVAEEVERARQRAIAEAKKKAEQEAAAKRKAEELARKKAAAEAAARENARRIAEAKAAEEKAKKARAEARDAAERERAEQRAREAESARVAAERKATADRERAEKEVAAAQRDSEDAVKLSSVDRLVNGGFEANKGRLPSPIAGGRIVSHQGTHRVEGLKTVVELENKGITIQGSPGSVVRSIYDGEVSAVFTAAGMTGVLVRHGAYISVYCNLGSVSVSRGQKVSARQALGTIGRDNILQFQLRRERNKLNPEAWLAR